VDSLDLAITDIYFQTTGSGAGTIRVPNTAIGPGGMCWYLIGDGATWASPLNEERAHVVIVPSEDPVLGMVVDLPMEWGDISKYEKIEFDADVSAGVDFGVALQHITGSYCVWSIPGEGPGEYTLGLDDPPETCWGNEDDEYINVRMFFGGDPNSGTSIEIAVTDIRPL
jgi:hypothetical protein